MSHAKNKFVKASNCLLYTSSKGIILDIDEVDISDPPTYALYSEAVSYTPLDVYKRQQPIYGCYPYWRIDRREKCRNGDAKE